MRRKHGFGLRIAVSLISFSLTPALFVTNNVTFAAAPGNSHSSSGSQVSPVEHIVNAGDTLWGISETYHVTIRSLEKWNGLSSQSTLQIGQRIIVGRSASTSGSWRHLQQHSYDGWNRVVNGNTRDGGLREEFVAYAEQFIGVPYVWGGDSPSGFDCSGLVQFTLRHFGVTLPRTSYDQYLAGAPVYRQDLQPGDLVFFDTDGPGASHNGIYVGNGKFINAADSGVQIDSMNTGYWNDYYIGARRVQ